MQYFLGLDAGGTKTTGALADEQCELARAEAGTIKLLRTGNQNARRNLESLLTQLTSSHGIDSRSITRVCIGTSGASLPLVTNWIRETIALLAGGELLLCGDDEIALDAAFRGGTGVLVVAGTGSKAAGRTQDGQMAYAGGWGPALGDEGSGHWIGQEGLRSAFRARNEGRSTQLLQSVMEYWQLDGLEKLVEKANAEPAPDFSKLAPLVVSCAQQGDAVALDICHRAGEDLARLALSVMRQLCALEEESVPRVAFTGSVLEHRFLVRNAMINALHRANPEIEILPQAVDPVQGAIWRARRGFQGSQNRTPQVPDAQRARKGVT